MECPKCNHVFTIPRKKKTPKETDPDVTKLIQYYIDAFKYHYKREPHVAWGACGTLAKRLLSKDKYEVLVYLIDDYITCGDKFFEETGYPFLLLPNYIQKKAVQKPKDSIPEWKKGPV